MNSSGRPTAGELEALKLKRMRVRNELSFLRSYQGSNREEQERVLREELHALNAEIEKAEGS